jgi:hypothetical protein
MYVSSLYVLHTELPGRHEKERYDVSKGHGKSQQGHMHALRLKVA